MILDVIGDVLALAIGVAISPIPIIAAILMLLSKNAGASSIGFGIGWVVGIVAVTGVVMLLSGSIHTENAESSTAVSTTKIVVGALLVLLAGRQWQTRSDTSVPKWMQAIDQLTMPRAAALGVALAAVNPKNLLLCVSAGITIGTGGLGGGQEVVVLLVFTAIAAISVLVPVLGYLVAADGMSGALASLKNWLLANNHAVMATLLLVMGAVVIGKGLRGL